MNARLDCIVAPSAEAVLAGLGRTEDVMFSPNGRRLAIAGFTADRIALFDIAIAESANGRKVVLSGAVEFTAATLRNPHGLCFLDDETLAIANREGGVQIYAVPASDLQAKPCVLEPQQTITGSAEAPIASGFRRPVVPSGAKACSAWRSLAGICAKRVRNASRTSV